MMQLILLPLVAFIAGAAGGWMLCAHIHSIAAKAAAVATNAAQQASDAVKSAAAKV